MRLVILSTLIFFSTLAKAEPAPPTDLSILSYFQALYPLISAASRATEEEGGPIVEPGRLWMNVYRPPFWEYAGVRAIRRIFDHVHYQFYPAAREANLFPNLASGDMLVHLPRDRAESLHYLFLSWRFIL